MKRTALLLAVAAGVAAGTALANGDPASDVLPFKPVFLSAQDPESSPSGRELISLADEAKRKRFPIRIAVIYQASDLGLIRSYWRKPQPYASFLGKELVTFGRYKGTLVVAMPNGFGVFGPGATPGAKAALTSALTRTFEQDRLVLQAAVTGVLVQSEADLAADSRG